MDLFLRNDELNITIYDSSKYLADLGHCGSVISSCVPWSSIRKFSIHQATSVSAGELESILQLAYNVDTLEIHDNEGVLSRLILRNSDHFGIFFSAITVIR